MKIVFVDNGHDMIMTPAKRKAIDEGAKRFPDAEVHIIPFEAVRSVLPITTAPCVLVLFDELAGDFDPANLSTILTTIAGKKLPKGLK